MAGPTPPEDLQGIPAPGEQVAGKFVVESVLGVGGMGVVVAAKHATLGQKVAIKFLRPAAAKSTEAVARFLREARSAVGLQSQHVVRVMDVGTLDSGLPYMVMEHLQGSDLGQVIAERKAVPVEEAVEYLLQAMEALAEAHSVGIVHRDLKPGNLFLSRRPDGSALVKVLDFGISKSVESEAHSPQSLTATATIMGSPLYMSPEQLRSTKNVDARTDVWALGVILYELLSGAPPFEADTMTGLCAKIVADPPVPLRSRRPDVPPELEAVVMRCLEKDAARRLASVGDVALALRPFAPPDSRGAVDRIARIGKAVSSGAAAPAPSGPSSSSPSGPHVSTGFAETVPTWQTASGQQRPRTKMYVGIGLGAALVVFLVGGVIRANHRPPTVVVMPEPVVAPPPSATIAPTASASTAVATPESAASTSAPAVASASAKPRPAAGTPRPKPASTDALLKERQ